MKRNALVLFSGGVDSLCCIWYFKQLGYNVKGLFVDYGQVALRQEELAIEKLKAILEVEVIKINSKINLNLDSGFIQGRNLLLLSLALANNPYNSGVISLGIHSGTNYADCSQTFVELGQKMLDLYTNGNLFLDCPFIEFNKRDIYNYFLETKIPINYTYSCEKGLEPPCGECLTCLDLKKIENEIKNQCDKTSSRS
ncbi:7-cyano-7-deazaguanine synthase [Wenyingzhuangia sp. IMCC45574]